MDTQMETATEEETVRFDIWGEVFSQEDETITHSKTHLPVFPEVATKGLHEGAISETATKTGQGIIVSEGLGDNIELNNHIFMDTNQQPLVLEPIVGTSLDPNANTWTRLDPNTNTWTRLDPNTNTWSVSGDVFNDYSVSDNYIYVGSDRVNYEETIIDLTDASDVECHDSEHNDVIYPTTDMYNCVCKICNQGFQRKSDLDTHMETHPEEETVRSVGCDQAFSNTQKGKLTCSKTCTKAQVIKSNKFSHAEYLNHKIKHVVPRKRQPEALVLKCKKCGEIFTRSSKYLAHVKIHEYLYTKVKVKDHKCEICGEQFYLPKALRKHLHVKHKIERNLNDGDIANKTLSEGKKSDKTTDKFREQKEKVKDHKCEICGKQFYLPKSLRIHLHVKHFIKRNLNNGDIANTTLSKKKKLDKTTRKKHAESKGKRKIRKVRKRESKTIACENIQKQIDSKERPHECPICRQRFLTYYSIYLHLEVKHGETLDKIRKTDQCNIVSEETSDTDGLNKEKSNTLINTEKCDIVSEGSVMSRSEELRNKDLLGKEVQSDKVKNMVQCYVVCEQLRDINKYKKKEIVSESTELNNHMLMCTDDEPNTDMCRNRPNDPEKQSLTNNIEESSMDLEDTSDVEQNETSDTFTNCIVGEKLNDKIDETLVQVPIVGTSLNPKTNTLSVSVDVSGDLSYIHVGSDRVNSEEARIKASNVERSDASVQVTEQNDVTYPTTDMCVREFKCNTCGEVFSRKSKYLAHVKIHNILAQKKVYECVLCGEEFSKKYNLLTHFKVTHRNVKPFECGICGRQFQMEVSLELHIEKHKREGLQARKKVQLGEGKKSNMVSTTNETDTVTSSEDSSDESTGVTNEEDSGTNWKNSYNPTQLTLPFLRSRRKPNMKTRNVPDEVFPNTNLRDASKFVCSRVKSTLVRKPADITYSNKDKHQIPGFQTLRGMQTLVNTHSGQDVTCEICGKQFNSIFCLMKHYKTHNLNVQFANVCIYCGKEFKYGSCLQKHLESHIGEQLPTFDACRQGLSQNSAPEDSLDTPTTEPRPSKCIVCDKEFTHFSDLQKHILKNEGCGKAFGQAMLLQKGATTSHEELKPSVCIVCGKLFMEVVDLAAHLRTHSGKGSYRCDICGKEFSHISYLSAHLQTHSNKNPHKCDTCGMEFSSETSILKKLLHKCSFFGKDHSEKEQLQTHAEKNKKEKFKVNMEHGEVVNKELSDRTKSDTVISSIKIEVGENEEEEEEDDNEEELLPAPETKLVILREDTTNHMQFSEEQKKSNLGRDQCDVVSEDLIMTVSEELDINSESNEEDSDMMTNTEQSEIVNEELSIKTEITDEVELGTDMEQSEIVNGEFSIKTELCDEMESSMVANKEPSEMFNGELTIKSELCDEMESSMVANEPSELNVRVKSSPQNSDNMHTYMIQTNEAVIDSSDASNLECDNSSSVNRHNSTYSTEDMCQICGKGFISDKDLKFHMMIHTMELQSKQDKLKCKICSQQFNYLGSLKQHYKKHKLDSCHYNNNKCMHCGKVFKYGLSLHRHILQTHNQASLPTNRVHSEGLNPTLASQAKFKPPKSNSTSCTMCHEEFPHLDDLQKHLLLHDGCSRGITEAMSLSKYGHPFKTVATPIKCVVCGKASKNIANLVTHLRIHKGRGSYQCNICGKEFSQICYLSAHLKTHTNERDTWGMEFSQNEILKRHAGVLFDRTKSAIVTTPEQCDLVSNKALYTEENAHNSTPTDEEPTIISRSAKSKDSDELMVRYVHVGKKRFTSPQRKSKESQNYMYLVNQRKRKETEKANIDSSDTIDPRDASNLKCSNSSVLKEQGDTSYPKKDIYNFKCNLCEQLFITKDDMDKHIQTHVGGEAIRCRLCGIVFSCRKSLAVHQRTHKMPWPVQDEKVCTICGKGFKLGITLQRHLKTHQ